MSTRETNKDANAASLGVLLGGIDACRRALGGAADAPTRLDDWRELLARCCDVDRLGAPETARLIRLAERLAAGGESAADAGSLSLRPVFDSIELEGRPPPPGRRFRLQRLTATADAEGFMATLPPPAPDAAPDAGERDALRQAFEAELGELRPRLRWEDFDCVHSHLLHVLHAYGWCLPAGQDVSIYSHRKASAAIAACLTRLDARTVESLDAALTRLSAGEALSEQDAAALDRPCCALVKGDISGTQDFLYLMASAGAARGLRGRSFYLQLLGETVARWALRQFGLPATNLLFAGGGHFYLLLPAAELADRWDALQRTIAEKLWRAHQGDLSLALGSVEVTARDLVNREDGFAEAWAEVSRRANEQKQRKWSGLGGQRMFASLFTPRQQGTTAEEMCQVCHGQWNAKRDRLDDNVRKCRRCDGFEQLGRELRNATHLLTFTVLDVGHPGTSDWHRILRSFGASVHLMDEQSARPAAPANAEAVRVELLDSFHLLEQQTADRFDWGALPVSAGCRLLADATPMKNAEEIAEFGDLAEASEGVRWLGVLRMDVDDLGRVFREGLGARATIARVSALSESLRGFFEGRVPQLCRNFNSFRSGGKDRVYLIYAGGDDLFVAGAWSALPQLAIQIRLAFYQFIGGNGITLSGGIAIEHPKFPLYQLAEDAKYALDDRAKALPAKNAICFLQQPMTWEQFAQVTKWRHRLLEMLSGEKRLARGFLTRMSEIHALYEENARRKLKITNDPQVSFNQIREEIHYSRWMWRLVHQIGRFGERHKNHKEQLDRFQQEITREADGLIPVLRVIARWAELQTREEHDARQ